MYINITDSETGNNKGSCAALVNYLEKENHIKENKHKPEGWFNGLNNSITHQEVRVKIDNNIAKLGRNDAKFYLINISPSQKEIGWLKEQFSEQGSEEQLKLFAVKVIDEYAKNFKRENIQNNDDLLWYGKLEHFRYYKRNDPEVKKGVRKKGDAKQGEQMHIQIIVSRKDITNKIKLSPLNNSRGKNAAHSAKLGQFDRKVFKQSGESLFDKMFGFERNLKETMAYAVTMKYGSSEQKKQLLVLFNNNFNEQNSDRITKESQHGLVEILKTAGNLNEALLEIVNIEHLHFEDSQDQTIYAQKKIKKKKRKH